MSKRTVLALAAGLVAGATVVGVPALAYAGGDDAGSDTTVSDMGAMMEDPAFRENAKEFMSEMMADPEMQEQMRSMMGDMGGMSGMGGMDGMDGMGDSDESGSGAP